MGFEIERKFPVRGIEWQQIATKYTEIRQAYLSLGGPQHD
jgi:CYTH domain-containing protein